MFCCSAKADLQQHADELAAEKSRLASQAAEVQRREREAASAEHEAWAFASGTAAALEERRGQLDSKEAALGELEAKLVCCNPYHESQEPLRACKSFFSPCLATRGKVPLALAQTIVCKSTGCAGFAVSRPRGVRMAVLPYATG